MPTLATLTTITIYDSRKSFERKSRFLDNFNILLEYFRRDDKEIILTTEVKRPSDRPSAPLPPLVLQLGTVHPTIQSAGGENGEETRDVTNPQPEE